MGLISSLFGKGKKKSAVTPEKEETKKGIASSPKLHLKGKPDRFGLYPAELVMLAFAEK